MHKTWINCDLVEQKSVNDSSQFWGLTPEGGSLQQCSAFALKLSLNLSAF